MEQLPTELLLFIFNKININDLINATSHVCERWRRIIAQDTVRQDSVQVVLSAYPQPSDTEHNHFLMNHLKDKRDLELLKNCRQLHIYLTANPQTPCNFHYFPILYHSCIFLHVKTLKVSVVTDRTCSYVPDNVCFDFEMGSIVEIINLYPDLEHLQLAILFISKKDAVRLTDILQKKEKPKFVEITMAIPLTNRIRGSKEYIEPLQLNKLFYFANITAKISASYKTQFMFSENSQNPIDDSSDYDCGLPNLGFV